MYAKPSPDFLHVSYCDFCIHSAFVYLLHKQVILECKRTFEFCIGVCQAEAVRHNDRKFLEVTVSNELSCVTEWIKIYSHTYVYKIASM